MDYFIVDLVQEKKVAIPLNQVQEVININYGDICPIPGVNDSLLGVINHRGNFLWILELSRFLVNESLPNLSLNTLTVLLTKIKHNNLGLVVQKLGEIKPVSQVSTSLKNDNSSYYQGILSPNIPILNLIDIKNTLDRSRF